MKQLRVILLLIFFLHSKIGVALNIHYCGGQIANVSWVFDAKDCGMETAINSTDEHEHDHFIAKMCCDDQKVVEQNTSDQLKIEGVDLELQADFNPLWTPVPVFRSTTHHRLVQYSSNAPPEKGLYLYYCSFIFYG